MTLRTISSSGGAWAGLGLVQMGLAPVGITGRRRVWIIGPPTLELSSIYVWVGAGGGIMGPLEFELSDIDGRKALGCWANAHHRYAPTVFHAY